MVEVTAIVPFHNDSATIGRTLASLVAQSHGLAEIIVVDDASLPHEADQLDRLVDGWQGPRPPVRVIHETTNRGPAAARNTGWAAATTPWIAFCDGDDVWHRERLATQITVSDGADLVCCWRAARPDAMGAPTGAPRVATLGRRALLTWNPVKTSAVLLRREVGPRFTAGRRYTEDYELWLRVVLGGGVARLVQHALIAPQIPDDEASGLTTHRWAMTRGEWETFRIVRDEGLLPLPAYAGAMALSVVRALRRHALVAATGVRRRRE